MLALRQSSHIYTGDIEPQTFRHNQEAYEATRVRVEVDVYPATDEDPAGVTARVEVKGWRLTAKGTRDKRQREVEAIPFSKWADPYGDDMSLSPIGELRVRVGNEAVAMTPGIDGIPVEIY